MQKEGKTDGKSRNNGSKKGQTNANDPTSANDRTEEEVRARSLKDLPALWTSEPEPDLVLPSPSSMGPEELSGQAEKIVEDQKKIHDWVNLILAKIDLRMEEVAKVDEEKEPRKKKILQRLMDPENEKDRMKIDSYLHGGRDPFHVEAALTAVFEYHFAKPHKTSAEIQATIKNLVEKKYLIEDSAGQLKVFEKAYNTNPTIGEEIDTVKKGLKDLISRVMDIERKSLSAQASLEVAEFLAGKKGTLTLAIHAEPVINHQTGKIEFWRRGGDILVESDGRKVKAIAVSGGIEETVKKGMAIKVYFFLDSLGRERPPYLREASDDEIKLTHSLWYIVRRGLLRHKFAARATISRKEFFLENRPGVCYLAYEGTWDVNSEVRLANFFFLVRREEKEGAKMIHLVDIPDHLKDFFAECMGDYPEGGNEFEGIPQPLQNVLRAGLTQTRKTEKKEGSIG